MGTRPSTRPPAVRGDRASVLNTDSWRLRGKLDVPKERWLSFPHCEGEEGSLMVA